MDNNVEIDEHDVDYSIVRGVADEPNWQKFVLQFGGELVAPLIVRPGIKNADFLFRTERVVAELKILETEFLDNVSITSKLNYLFNNPINFTGDQLCSEIIKIIQAPLQRVINKANRQIKETKHELRLVRWRGLLIIVNDGFKGLPPGLVMGLCAKILSGKSYSSCDALIYLTNHCVELPDDPYARLLWAPLYHPSADQDLPEFVNELGRAWRRYAESIDGPYDSNSEAESADLKNARVVTGLRRETRYLGP